MKIVIKVIVQGEILPEPAFALEQWLNDTCTRQAYEKFGVGLRFHVQEYGEEGRNDR